MSEPGGLGSADGVVVPRTDAGTLRTSRPGVRALAVVPETPPVPRSSRLRRSSAREEEVLVLLAAGLSDQEIAGRLFVTEATVKTHVARVLAELEVRDRVQAVVAAFRGGLVDPLSPAAPDT